MYTTGRVNPRSPETGLFLHKASTWVSGNALRRGHPACCLLPPDFLLRQAEASTASLVWRPVCSAWIRPDNGLPFHSTPHKTDGAGFEIKCIRSEIIGLTSCKSLRRYTSVHGHSVLTTAFTGFFTESDKFGGINIKIAVTIGTLSA